jgi:iduronate 2-sulfatase
MSTGSSGQPNVLFIICDDLNNALASMGRTPFAPAPNLRRLMRRGVRFTNAHNNCPICLPSRNSMLSGLYPHTTGHYTLWDRWRTQRPIPTTSGGREYAGIPLLGEAIMLPKHFRDHGYRTFGVGKVHHQGETDSSWWTEYAYGPDYGPFLWDEIRQAQRARPDRVWLYEGEPMLSYTRRYEGLDRFFLDGERFRHHVEMAFGSLPEVFSDADTEIRGTNGAPFRYVSDDDRDPLPDEKTTGWALDVLRQDHDRPFFLAVGYMKPHTPLNVPQRWFDRFPLDEIALPPFLEDDVDDCARALVEHRPYGFLAYDMILKGGERLWRKWLQSYLACVAFVDEQVGTLLDALDENGHSDDTIIVFTSDNGYHMGEKSYIYKDSLWEESGQIPLIVSAPGVGGSDRVCTQPVSLVDLYPTLIDLCDLPGDPHAATHGHPLEGHSLRPLLDDPEDGVWAGPSVAITSVRGDTGIHHSVRSERYRYTLCQNGEEELYDHDADPYEWHNRAGDPRYATDQVALRQQMMHLLYP